MKAATLKDSCYYEMFLGCTKLKVKEVESGGSWVFPESVSASYWNYSMISSIAKGSTTSVAAGKQYRTDVAFVTYNLNGGAWDSEYTAQDYYVLGTGLTLPTATNISKAGCTFEGWYDNAECTGDSITSIDTSASDDKTYYAKWHHHGAWTYSVENTSSLKATCGNPGCTSPAYSISLTLSAEDADYSGSAATITVGTEAERSAWSAEKLTVPTVHYVGRDGTVLEDTTTAPTAIGKYTAKISMGEPAVTASVNFEIKKNNLTKATSNMSGIILDNPDFTFDAEKIAVIFSENNITPEIDDIVIYKKSGDNYQFAMYYGELGWKDENSTDLGGIIGSAGESTIYVIGTITKPSGGGSGSGGGGATPAPEEPETPEEPEEPTTPPTVAPSVAPTVAPTAGTEVADTNTGAKVEIADPANKEVTYTAPITEDKKVTVPDVVVIGGVEYKVTKIDEGAFENNKTLTSVTIGSNVTEIGDNAFKGCTNLKTVTLPKAVVEIGDGAFKGCSSLTKVTIPSKVKEVGANAFDGCKNLKKVALPSKVTKIGAKAFNGCKNLNTITISSTKLTSKSVSKNAFKGVSKNTVIKVPKSKLDAYKKMFAKKGLSSKVKVKAK